MNDTSAPDLILENAKITTLDRAQPEGRLVGGSPVNEQADRLAGAEAWPALSKLMFRGKQQGRDAIQVFAGHPERLAAGR